MMLKGLLGSTYTAIELRRFVEFQELKQAVRLSADVAKLLADLDATVTAKEYPARELQHSDICRREVYISEIQVSFLYARNVQILNKRKFGCSRKGSCF